MDDTATLTAPGALQNASVSILVVDDQPVVRLLQAKLLEHLGLQAKTAANGRAALQMLDAAAFDLLLTDCDMPLMDGYELARQVRAGGSDYCNIPIIACTAHAIPEVTRECLGAGMNAVLSKPLQASDLERELQLTLPGLGPLEQVTPGQLVFDEEQFHMLAGNDAALRRTLVDSFLQDFHRSCAELVATIRSFDRALCREIAHRNKGACAVFGALELGAAFALLENLAKRDSATAQELQVAMENIELVGSQLSAGLANLPG